MKREKKMKKYWFIRNAPVENKLVKYSCDLRQVRLSVANLSRDYSLSFESEMMEPMAALFFSK